jgi:hypothetical protein
MGTKRKREHANGELAEGQVVVDSDSSDHDDVVNRKQRTRRHRGVYGSSSDEIGEALCEVKFGVHVRCLDPDKFYGAAKLKNPISCSGQLLIPCNISGGHWVAVCIDFDHKQYGLMGVRRLPAPVSEFLTSNGAMVNVDEFTDIGIRGIGSQNESECGARVLKYCVWFGTVRERGQATGRSNLNAQDFQKSVNDQMQEWRAVR